MRLGGLLQGHPGRPRKFVGQLNAAFSFAIHVTDGEAIARVSAIIGKLVDLGGQSTHNAESQVFDPCTEAAAQKRRRGGNQAAGAYWQDPRRSREVQVGRSMRTGLAGEEPSLRSDGQPGTSSEATQQNPKGRTYWQAHGELSQSVQARYDALETSAQSLEPG